MRQRGALALMKVLRFKKYTSFLPFRNATLMVIFSIIFLLLMLEGRGLLQEKSNDAIEDSDRLYFSRDKEGNEKRCLSLLLSALEKDRNSYEILWRLARILWWMAEGENDKEKKKRFAWEGYQYGLKAMELEPERIEGPLWGVAALGEYSMSIGVITALAKGIEGRFRDMVEKAYKLDKRHTWGAPPRILGRFYYCLPWPKRNLAKSESYLLESLKIAPDYLRTRYYLAETYIEMGREREARREIEKIMDLGAEKDPDPVDGKRVIGWTKRLIKKMGW